MTTALILKWFSALSLGLIGLIGATVAAPFHPEVKGIKSLVVFILSGAACAYFLTGLIAEYLHIPASSLGGVGFLVGAFSGSLIDAIMRAIRNADLWAFFCAKFGRGE